MEAAVWTDPAVKSKIDNDYILVTLMVDDKNPLPEPIVVKEKMAKNARPHIWRQMELPAAH